MSKFLMMVDNLLSINKIRHKTIKCEPNENNIVTKYEPIMANNSKTKIKMTFYEKSLINL